MAMDSQGLGQSGGRPRARDLGIPFSGPTGAANAITDVPGVTVGHTTLIDGDRVRTGVTAILPRSEQGRPAPVWAGMFSFNGAGELTGSHFVAEYGWFLGPICLTGTHNVGVVHKASLDWFLARHGAAMGPGFWHLPIVGETWDGFLNDSHGGHLKAEHVLAALDGATGGPVAEGAVGGGTGMSCYQFKAGIGTASRLVKAAGDWTVAALVQANFGRRDEFRPFGRPYRPLPGGGSDPKPGEGSIIGIVATDAPLLPHQLQRLARRAAVGMARTGTSGNNGSGDIFMAFSTANALPLDADRGVTPLDHLPNEQLNPVFAGAADAVEEAILNAIVAADTMVGRAGNRVEGIDRDAVRAMFVQQ
ncbi:L-aminopeptidase DmpA [Stella humosa]|uniref:L-aminopeptidase DmpA n=1 Tax=Stella humosa TaxID=94 RepID=A0A3N1KL33_9PROT|nr:P1 family peptidase [Stella humosa]ROP81114.1 L-aminopeptidase DmpA [Stella humosa]BBK32459.1 aminopeptidase [Stella humosa]